MTTSYQAASDFKPLPGEANFAPPIGIEVVGGTHIAPECITHQDDHFVMTHWPNGLPRHETVESTRFPHGLIRFGESIEACATRLVESQLGMKVESVRVLEIDSYVDDMDHWHIEPLLSVVVSGDPHTPSGAGGVVRFTGTNLPPTAVWGEASFSRVYLKYFAPPPV